MEQNNVATGSNPFLGKLICYSCGEHARNHYDKTLRADWTHIIYITKTGKLSMGCECCDTEFLSDIVTEVEKISAQDLIEFGDGVAIEFFRKKLECAQCGSEEFCKL